MRTRTSGGVGGARVSLAPTRSRWVAVGSQRGRYRRPPDVDDPSGVTDRVQERQRQRHGVRGPATAQPDGRSHARDFGHAYPREHKGRSRLARGKSCAVATSRCVHSLVLFVRARGARHLCVRVQPAVCYPTDARGGDRRYRRYGSARGAPSAGRSCRPSGASSASLSPRRRRLMRASSRRAAVRSGIDIACASSTGSRLAVYRLAVPARWRASLCSRSMVQPV